ncbi:MAG: acetate/propionate family kinase [Mahellales bacterium]|jgi:acetate kinase
MKIFILNCGGSSVKFQLMNMPGFKTMAKGSVERVGKEDAVFKFQARNEKELVSVMNVADHQQGIEIILKMLLDPENRLVNSMDEIDAIGHRVVHGGEKCKDSVLIDDTVLENIKACAGLAPLHNPASIAGIQFCSSVFKGIPQVAVFDNGLHQTLPEYTYLYALPYEYYKKYGIRKYGFHGIAFRSIVQGATKLLGRRYDDMKIVSLMLGSGTTANAMKYGRSIEISTGFTPLEGLIQSTRAGDIDAAAVLYLMKREDISPSRMEDILNKESGWLGLSGVSNDMREIHNAALQGDNRANTAIRAVVHRIKKYIGAYCAVMGGMDVLAFSGGVGENAWYIREMACQDMAYLGLELDKDRNKGLKGEGLISTPQSRVKIIVVNANEEEIIAQDTFDIVSRM